MSDADARSSDDLVQSIDKALGELPVLSNGRDVKVARNPRQWRDRGPYAD